MTAIPDDTPVPAEHIRIAFVLIVILGVLILIGAGLSIVAARELLAVPPDRAAHSRWDSAPPLSLLAGLTGLWLTPVVMPDVEGLALRAAKWCRAALILGMIVAIATMGAVADRAQIPVG